MAQHEFAPKFPRDVFIELKGKGHGIPYIVLVEDKGPRTVDYKIAGLGWSDIKLVLVRQGIATCENGGKRAYAQ